LRKIERLLYISIATPLHNFVGLPGNRVPTGQYHGYLRFYMANRIECFATVQIRHNHIQNHQVNFIAHILDGINRLGAAIDCNYFIAELFQHFFANVADNCFIIDQKDGLVSTRA